ncbi:hypothetical protein FOVSG1_014750 [Fusarium oxysporum f. sp. vasinfectum]
MPPPSWISSFPSPIDVSPLSPAHFDSQWRSAPVVGDLAQYLAQSLALRLQRSNGQALTTSRIRFPIARYIRLGLIPINIDERSILS